MVLRSSIALLTLIPSPDAATLGMLYFQSLRLQHNAYGVIGSCQCIGCLPGLFLTWCSVYIYRVNRDLGQFERFRRIIHTPYYSVLLSHVQYSPLSSLQVSHAY